MSSTAAPLSPSSISVLTRPDQFGLSITLPAHINEQQQIRCIQCIDQYYQQVLLYGRAWDCILGANEITSDCMMAQVLAIDFWMAKDDIPRALSQLSTAQSLFRRLSASASSPLSQREQFYFHAFELVMKGKINEAIQVFKELLVSSPSDLFAIKRIQLLCFILGDRASMSSLVVGPSIRSACDQKRFYRAMLAFALEEQDRLDEAQKEVQQAIEQDDKDPWAYHVRAHIMYTKAELEDGAEWLTSHSSAWSECMSFLYCHNWFHIALLRLDLNQYERVAEIFDDKVWPFDMQTADDASSSASSSCQRRLPVDSSTTSFGVPLTPLSFSRHDAHYVEDQNAAINLLWRMEIRASTADETAEAAAASSSASSVLSSSFFLARWRSLYSYLKNPPSQLLSLFGLLQLHVCYRSGERQRGDQLLESMNTAVETMDEGAQKSTMKGGLIQLARAIKLTHENEEQSNKEAFDILCPLFDPSPSSLPPAQPACLSSLSASVEQAEVLVEWWLQLCVRTKQQERIKRWTQVKPAVRIEKVQWYKDIYNRAQK